MSTTQMNPAAFTSYEKLVVAILAFLQFSVILDFMIVSPLGAILMPALSISPSQFALIVSVYAFAAGTSGLLAAGFADRFDRKKMLLFFYTGFLGGTLMCGLVHTFEWLVAARLITGIFGGVIGSIVFAIITDLFPIEKRGRVMGFVQSAFAASQILGLPLGLYFSNLWGWEAPFLMIVVIGIVAGAVIFTKLKPVDAHLKLQTDHNPIGHLVKTLVVPRHLLAFSATALLSIGGFLMMPFGSDFTVHNMGIDIGHLPMIYMITGIAAMLSGPLVGRAVDMFGSFKVFVFGTCLGVIMVLIYSHLGETPLPYVILVNVVMFIGIFSRMIPSQTLISTIPNPANRGAFMSISSSLQQIAGGFASVLAGMIVVKSETGRLEHFEVLGYVMAGTAIVTLVLMWIIARQTKTPAKGA